MGYVMLDVFGSSAQFEQGFSAGQEEERNRIINAFHQEVSSPLIAALFLIQKAKNELEDTDLPQAETVSKASDILTETTEKIADVLARADRNSA
jgi:signal transduction histidine kinase